MKYPGVTFHEFDCLCDLCLVRLRDAAKESLAKHDDMWLYVFADLADEALSMRSALKKANGKKLTLPVTGVIVAS